MANGALVALVYALFTMLGGMGAFVFILAIGRATRQ